MQRRQSRKSLGKRFEQLCGFRTVQFETLEHRCLLAADVTNLIDIDLDNYDPSRILLKLKDDVAATPSDLISGADFDQPFTSMPGLFQIELPEAVEFDIALSSLRSSPLVDYAEPDYQIRITAVPDDTRYTELWGLNNTGQTGGTNDVDIDAPEAWDIHTGSGNTIVAVIDTGVDYTHPDLADNMWTNTAELNGTNGVDDDGNGFVDDIYGYDFVNNDPDPFDDHIPGHGTHVAGTIGAVGDNSLGIAGVNWDVQIMALKFLDSSGGGSTSDAIAAIDYAVANGATISNNSWGFNGGFSQALYDAVENARDQDHIFVAAAGNGFFGFPLNNDTTPFWPSSMDLENIVAVAATDHNDQIASFSNYGATSVDLAAPGVGILSTTPNNSYGLLSGTSMASPHVTGLVALIRDISPGWSYQQVIDHVLNHVDPISAMAGRSVTGGRLNAANAVMTASPAPEVQVKTLTANIEDDGVFDFGSTAPGVAITETFTVKNLGSLPLTIGDPTINLATGLSLTSTFAGTTLETGESVSFSVRLDAVSEGSFAGAVSFATNDEDENPFNFAISGAVAIPPAVQIIDNGDSNFVTVGEWSQWTGQGYADDVHESFPGGGSDVASWTFDRLLPGKYWVAATWNEYSNRATDAPYTIQTDTPTLHTVRVDQQAAPNDLWDDGAYWEYLDGPYDTADGTLVVSLSDGADGRLNADAIRIERLPESPEVDVLGDGISIPDETGSVELPTSVTGVPSERTFTVVNRGLETLELYGPITLPNGYSLVSSFDDTQLEAGESTTFTVQLDATSVGVFSGSITFGTNDADEGTFDFGIAGTVVRIIDNGDLGFSSIGEWTAWNGQGYQNDVHESFEGTGTDLATWTFDGLDPGVYRLAATWSEYTNRASNATFTVIDDGTTAIVVDQQNAPQDFTDGNATWDYLGGAYQTTTGTIVVQLNDLADGRLNADAIRLEPLPHKAEIQVLAGNVELIDAIGNVDFGNTPAGSPVAQTFTAVNLGALPLTLDTQISIPNGFTLTSGFGATTLLAGESTQFTVQLDAASSGWYEGEISINSNDADESPFTITVSGTVADSPPIQVMDNDDASFSTSGEWTRWTGQGRDNSVHESLPGNGTDVASWTFSGLEPGTYQVSATWFAWSNRASNSPFTILDGTTARATVPVNQQINPDDFAADGSNWEYVGVPIQITGQSLVVELSDNANGNLNADAIRIERLNDETRIVDNGDPSFSSVGEWTQWTGQGFKNDVHESFPGFGVDVATWSFAGMQPGTYRIAATWTDYTNRAPNAPFTILDGGTNLGTVLVNQQLPADDFAAAGALWEDLGGLFTITEGDVVVQLADAANGRVNADAVRLERIIESNIIAMDTVDDGPVEATQQDLLPWFVGVLEALSSSSPTAVVISAGNSAEPNAQLVDLSFLASVFDQAELALADQALASATEDLDELLAGLDDLFADVASA